MTVYQVSRICHLKAFLRSKRNKKHANITASVFVDSRVIMCLNFAYLLYLRLYCLINFYVAKLTPSYDVVPITLPSSAIVKPYIMIDYSLIIAI